MPEAEIGKSGEVVVEGHLLGRLDGFTFAPDTSVGVSEAKALNAAAQKVLAVEIEARATRLAQARDDQFVLASDGAIRWLGDVVARLNPGEDALRPRVRIVADEHLTGAPRDAVQARLDLWLKVYLDKLLGPLFALGAAEDVTGIARGVAFQLVEALGVLERQKVADEVRGLDQTARATLRKHGVRFGAFHIYMPLLLKPAARTLAMQLATLKHAELNVDGTGDLQHLAASGRTSIPAKKELPRALYRTIGYRVCGERAVRVDILERLADLIRAALTWRPGAPGPKPAGALDGSGFTIAGAMTSLIGASGEDMASILRSLGYRMEVRTKPAEPDQSPAAPVVAAEKPAVADADASPNEPDTSSTAVMPEADPVPIVPDAEIIPVAEMRAPASEPEPLVVSTTPAADATQEEAQQAQMLAAGGGTEPAAAEEPVMIEVWRPGRRSDESRESWRPSRRRGRGREDRPDHQRAPAEQSAAAAADGAALAVPDGTAVEEQRRRRGRRPHRRDREQRADEAGRGDRQQRTERETGGDRPPRRQRDRDHKDDRAPRHEREQRRPAFQSRPSPTERRDKQPDPNSPFAKLAALKEQLEAASKERR